ncbi:MAG: hypothetical protein ACR2LQ_02820 [Acidimicrobiales bacterium]
MVVVVDTGSVSALEALDVVDALDALDALDEAFCCAPRPALLPEHAPRRKTSATRAHL